MDSITETILKMVIEEIKRKGETLENFQAFCEKEWKKEKKF